MYEFSDTNRTHKRYDKYPLKKSRIPCCLCLVPQRQQIPQFSAVADSLFPPPPCYKPSGQHCLCYPFPQRHHFPRFAAVADRLFLPHPCYKPSGQHCLCYPFPQRHHFPRFAAVVERPFLPHSFGRSSLSLHQPYSFQRSNGNENHPEHVKRTISRSTPSEGVAFSRISPTP